MSATTATMTFGLRSTDALLAAALTVLLREQGAKLLTLPPVLAGEISDPLQLGCDAILCDLDTLSPLGIPGELTLSFDPRQNPTLLRPFREETLLRTLFSGEKEALFKAINQEDRPSASPHRHSSFYFDGTALYGGGKQVFLSARERQVFSLLYKAGGRVVSTEQIAREVWGSKDSQNDVHVYMRYLRKKLEEVCPLPCIITVRGVGFRLRTDDSL